MSDENILKINNSYDIYQTDTIKEYLEDMALKGWRLKNLTNGYTFEKIEPKKLIYSVAFFEKKDKFDEKPEDMLEYIEYCKAAGWQYIDETKNLLIFVSENENIVPIETDQTLKYQRIKRYIIKEQLFSWLRLLWTLIYIPLIIYNGSYIDFTTEYFFIAILYLLIINVIINLKETMKIIHWCYHSGRQIKRGERVKYSYEVKKEKAKTKITLSALMMLLVFISIISVFINGFKTMDFIFLFSIFMVGVFTNLTQYIKFIKLKNHLEKRGTVYLSGFILLALISGILTTIKFETRKEQSTPLPITLEGLGEETYSHSETECELNSTFLASLSEFRVNTFNTEDQKNYNSFDYNWNYIDYSIFKSKIPGVIDFYVYGLTHRPIVKYKQSDPSAWGAKAVFIINGYFGSNIVVFDDVIFIYSSNVEFDEKDIAYIKDAIGVS